MDQNWIHYRSRTGNFITIILWRCYILLSEPLMRKILILTGIVLAGAIYFYFNPANTHLFPKCPFLSITGFKCPGCGSQRAVHALLHLDISSAFFYNALLVASLPIIAVLAFSEIKRGTYPSLYSKIHNPLFIWVYFAIVIAWCISRNIFNL